MKKKRVFVLILVLFILSAGCTAAPFWRNSTLPPNTEPSATLNLTNPMPSPNRFFTPSPTVTPVSTMPIGLELTRINDLDGAELIYVPSGTFLMGSKRTEAQEDETPDHIVHVDAFWIYKNEVTNAQFAVFVAETGYETTAEKRGWSWIIDAEEADELNDACWFAPEGPGSTVIGKENYPVILVSWYDAVAYCEWAGGYLPTEAEWEKAARGEDRRIYSWGNDHVDGTLANFCDQRCIFDWRRVDIDDGYDMTAPVGSFPDGASPYGLLDVSGNVWEWVADWYDAEYYNNSLEENPIGPVSGEFRVIRGGSWYNNEWNLRVTNRHWFGPDYTNSHLGFRCRLSTTP